MTALSNYTEAQVVNALLRGTDLTAPAVSSLHLALFVADPTDSNATGGEVVDPWYSRIATGSWTAPSVNADGKTETRNTAAINFDAVVTPDEANDSFSGSFDADGHYTITISHIGIYDANTAGNLLFHAPLETVKTLENGDVISFAINALGMILD